MDTCQFCGGPFETTIVGWAGITGWVFDTCWGCAYERVCPL